MTITGFHEDIPEAEYHDDTNSVSQSGLKKILESPALFRYELDRPSTPSDAMLLGTLVHTEVLGVGQRMHVVPPTGRKKAEQEAHAAAVAEAEAADLIPVTQERAERVWAMGSAVMKNDTARALLTGGSTEISAYSPDPETGVMRRCRFDKLHDDLGVDLKTSAARTRSAFAKSAATYGYHQQHSYYVDIAADLGQPLRSLVFVTVTSTEPHDVFSYELDIQAVMRGRELNDRALRIYKHCTEAGDWSAPGARTIQPLSLPRWAYYDDDLEITA
jgi:hypothetical protein